MRLKNNAWTFEGAFSKEQCKQLIDYGNDQVTVTAATNKDTVNKLRKSEVAWLYDPWVMQMLEPYVDTANREADWNFQWEPAQAIQFTKYKKGDHYGWHRDTAIPWREDGKIRKLSITVNLNDDYEGGELWFPYLNIAFKPQKGDILMFPSTYIYAHASLKVTSGTKYSAVTMFDYNDNNHKQPLGYATDGSKVTENVGISKGGTQPIMYAPPR